MDLTMMSVVVPAPTANNPSCHSTKSQFLCNAPSSLILTFSLQATPYQAIKTMGTVDG